MATITVTENPTPQLNAWNVPPGHQSHGIPRAEIVFSTQFTIAQLGVGDGWVLNLAFTPPKDYFYRVVDLNFIITAISEADIDDVAEAAFTQYRNFRSDGSEAQFFSFFMVNTSFQYRQDTAEGALIHSMVTSSHLFGATFKPDLLRLPGIILSTAKGAGDVFMNLENNVASSDGSWICFAYCRMLQYDISDEFEYLLHTPNPVVPA